MSSLPRGTQQDSLYTDPSNPSAGPGTLERPKQRKGQAVTDRGTHRQPERGAVRCQTDRETRTDRQARVTQTQTAGFVCVSQLLAPQEPCPEQVLPTLVLLEEARSLGLPGGPGPGGVPREPVWLAGCRPWGDRVEELSLSKGLKQKEVGARAGGGLGRKEDKEAGLWESPHPSPRPHPSTLRDSEADAGAGAARPQLHEAAQQQQEVPSWQHCVCSLA